MKLGKRLGLRYSPSRVINVGSRGRFRGELKVPLAEQAKLAASAT